MMTLVELVEEVKIKQIPHHVYKTFLGLASDYLPFPVNSTLVNFVPARQLSVKFSMLALFIANRI